MSEDFEDDIATIIDVALSSNEACHIAASTPRTFSRRVASGDFELVTIVALVYRGLIYGHVMFDKAVGVWRAFLLHSTKDLRLMEAGDAITRFHETIADPHDYSPIFSTAVRSTSWQTNSPEKAVEALSDIITHFDPSSAWPREPSSAHQLDFTPIDAYGSIQRLRR